MPVSPIQPVLQIAPATLQPPSNYEQLMEYIEGPMTAWFAENDISNDYLRQLQVVLVGEQHVLVLERFDTVGDTRRIAVDAHGVPSSHTEVYPVTAPPTMPV